MIFKTFFFSAISLLLVCCFVFLNLDSFRPSQIHRKKHRGEHGQELQHPGGSVFKPCLQRLVRVGAQPSDGLARPFAARLAAWSARGADYTQHESLAVHQNLRGVVRAARCQRVFLENLAGGSGNCLEKTQVRSEDQTVYYI